MAPTTSSIEFPIRDVKGDAPMKPIPLIALPNSHGLSFEDLETFLFEFNIMCWGYDYIYDA